jgi:hypothetical protein
MAYEAPAKRFVSRCEMILFLLAASVEELAIGEMSSPLTSRDVSKPLEEPSNGRNPHHIFVLTTPAGHGSPKSRERFFCASVRIKLVPRHSLKTTTKTWPPLKGGTNG